MNNNTNPINNNMNQNVNNQGYNQQRQIVNNNTINTAPKSNIKKTFDEKPKKVKLLRFKFKAKNQEGEIIEDIFDAEKQLDVQSFLQNKGYQILSLQEDKLSTSLGLAETVTSKKLSSKNLNFFLTQLSTYVKSGIPLVDSMEILSRQTKDKNNKMVYKRIVFELNKGVSFSTCLEMQGRVFPKMLINMLKTSEMTGDLTGVLDDMAIYYKRQDTNRKEIINAMIYPSVLLIFAFAVLTFVITYVVPSFTSMYETAGANLPKITLIIMNISDFIIGNWYYILGGIITAVVVLSLLYKALNQAKYGMQWIVMHIPVVSSLVKYNQLITFTSTFATLIKHDVFITDSMDILSRITDNEIYKRIINDAITNLSKGNGVSVAFKGQWAFPDTAYEMLLTGEKTGKLGEMLEHVTAYYQEEQTNMVGRLKSLVEPIMIVMLAVLVGVILLAVVVPMFDIYSTIV